jgi:NTE family protein
LAGGRSLGIFTRKVRLNLALQGGGAHGAFTWGVLDRLLEESRVEIGWVSGTSAGAINAVALAAGLLEGGREAARDRLGTLWHSVPKAGVPDLLRFNPFLYSLSRLPAVTQMASLLSPYEFNPLGFDPLRRLLTDNIDFELLRSGSPIQLVISATDVATGRARHFRNPEITVEAVLASACLPTLHHAVEIEGKAYWDGAFSANPDLVTLASGSPIRDTLIVQINPTMIGSLPMGVQEISNHANTLTFNAPLLRDIAIIETARKTLQSSLLHSGGEMARLARHRFHLVEASRYTSVLRPDTKVIPDWGVLNYLYGAGKAEAGKWIEKHLKDVGRRNSVDLSKRYLEARPDISKPAGGEETPGTPVDALASIPVRQQA